MSKTKRISIILLALLISFSVIALMFYHVTNSEKKAGWVIAPKNNQPENSAVIPDDVIEATIKERSIRLR